MATMPERLVATYDAIFNGGKSMLHSESLQFQIDRAGERTWKKHLIGPFKDSKGKDYFTTPAQQAQYDALALARIEGNTAVIQNLVKALANVSGGESFDQAKLLAGIEKLLAEAVVKVEVSVEGGK